MKILVVNKFFWVKGGSERVMFDLIRGYEAAGHEVVPFAMASPRNIDSEHAGYFVPEVSFDGESRSLLGAVRAVYSPEAKRRIRALVRATRPDVAHLHNFHHQLSPSIVDALREEGVPCVHTLHDYKVICPNYLLYTEGRVCERCKGGRFHEAIFHRCLKNAVAPSVVAYLEMSVHRMRRTLERGVRFFVSPSRFLRGKLTEFGVPEARTRFVPNGLDPGEFDVARVPGQDFLYLGRLSPEKGILTVVEALKRATGVRLVISGSGPEEEVVRSAAARDAPGRIEMTGYLDRDELLRRVRGARAVVLPSLWYENAPIAALEALASGVPVIGADIGGIPEIVRDGESGLVFPAGDSSALAERLNRLNDDPALAGRLGRRGREILEAEYSLTGQVERMLGLLEEVRACASR